MNAWGLSATTELRARIQQWTLGEARARRETHATRLLSGVYRVLSAPSNTELVAALADLDRHLWRWAQDAKAVHNRERARLPTTGVESPRGMLLQFPGSAAPHDPHGAGPGKPA